MTLYESIMRHKYKTALQVCSILVLLLIIAHVWSSRMKRQKLHQNPFEIDLYDDGDYSESERRKAMLAQENGKGLAFNQLAVGLPMSKKKVKQKPPVPVPEIFIQTDPPIVLTENMSPLQIEDNFFRYLEYKDVICKDDKRVGYQHDGGYNVCFSPPLGLKKPCVVFSFGIGDNWLFDDATSKIYGCKVFSYDPTVNFGDHNRSDLIKFQRKGLGKKTEINKHGWNMKTLARHLKDEGYGHSKIDYLKFDIEYNEWAVLKSIFQEGSLKHVRQLGFEMHLNELFQSKTKLRFQTSKADFLSIYHILETLKKLNFRKFNYRLNPFGEYDSKLSGKKRSFSYELHYINMNYVPSNYTILAKSKAKNK